MATSLLIRGLQSAALLIRGLASSSSATTAAGFEVDLQAWIVAQLGLAVYPVHIPQQIDPSVEVLPCYTFELITAHHKNVLSGPTGDVTGTFHLKAHSFSATEAFLMKEALRLKLQNYRGFIGATRVKACNLHDEASNNVTPLTENDRWKFERLLVFKIFYVESLPQH
jgi:hypothetical protein